MRCPNCRHEINYGAQFCGNCGMQLAQPQPTTPQVQASYPQPLVSPAHAPLPSQPLPPQYGQQVSQHPQYAQEDPGQIFGIIGLVMIMVFAPVGIVLSIIGRSKSKAVGLSGGLSTVALIINIVFTVLFVLFFALGIWWSLHDQAQKCATYGPGTHRIDGETYYCD